MNFRSSRERWRTPLKSRVRRVLGSRRFAKSTHVHVIKASRASDQWYHVEHRNGKAFSMIFGAVRDLFNV